MDMYFVHKMPVSQILRRIPISKRCFYDWVAIFAKSNVKEIEVMGKKKSSSPKDVSSVQEGSVESTLDEIRYLRSRISLLEKELSEEKLRADAYETMVTLAESTFNIQIRKKSGAKQ